MNKKQIKAELRRAAATSDPWLSLKMEALHVAYRFEDSLIARNHASLSLFFLLVAEAL